MKVQEFLNGGLVQTRTPILLQPGELQSADNTVLRPGNPALHKAPGRAAYGTVSSTSVASCSTTLGSPTLTTGSAIATALSVDALVKDSTKITSTTEFGSVTVGQSLYGAGLPANTHVRRKVSSSEIEIDKVITAAGAISILHSDYHPGTFLKGAAAIVEGTYISTITAANTVTMSANATGTANASLSVTFSEAITGLNVLTFDGTQTDVLIAKAAHKIYSSSMTGVTGTFAEFKAGLSHNSESTLSNIAIKNRHVVLTGYDIPRVIYYDDDGTNGSVVSDRALGMLPVQEESFVGPSIIPGTWPATAEFDKNYYYFLITEVARFGEDIVEGTYEGLPRRVEITDPTSQGVRITYTDAGNQPVNDGLYGRNLATDWRVYMSARKDYSTSFPVLAEFRLVAEAPIAAASIDLADTNPNHSGYAGKVDDVGGGDAILLTSRSANAISSQLTFTVASSVLTKDNSEVTSSAGFGNVTAGMYVFSPSNSLPAGCVVSSKDTSSKLYVDPPATVSISETLTFGNKSTFDNTYAECPNNPSDAYRSAFFHDFALADTIGNFSSGTVSGIEVEIKGLYTSSEILDPGFDVTLYQGGLAGTASNTIHGRFQRSSPYNKDGGGSLGEGVIKLGSATSDWGVSWATTDFADADSPANKFGVKIKKLGGPSTSSEVAIHSIDGVKVTVFAGSSGINSTGDPFRVVTIRDQLNNNIDIGAAGPPPVASTGDVFNGILVLNDVASPSVIVGSLPDEEEAFPVLYRIPIQSKDNDKIQVIRSLGNVCVIGMLNSIKRLNYFPLETDPDFSQGRCYEDIATDHGMVGPRAQTLIDLPGRGPILAYLSHKGIYWTDGITCMPLNNDIDWESLFANTLIQKSVLTVYPRLHLLALYYVPSGGTSKTKALYFSYHPTHMKEGFQLPATGPVDAPAESATPPLIGGVSYLFTGHAYNGKVYQEDSGTTDENDKTPIPVIRTRRYLINNGMGDQFRVDNIHLLLEAAGNSTSGAFTGTLYKQNTGEAVTSLGTVSGNTAVGGITQLWPDVMADSFDFSLTQALNTVAFQLHYLGFDLTNYGESTS